jgi:hypothetical protein
LGFPIVVDVIHDKEFTKGLLRFTSHYAGTLTCLSFEEMPGKHAKQKSRIISATEICDPVMCSLVDQRGLAGDDRHRSSQFTRWKQESLIYLKDTMILGLRQYLSGPRP